MSASSRFPVAIHVLALLARKDDCSATSETIGRSVNTNPVVIRRLLSQLRNAGLVSGRCGPGGGTVLARPADAITLCDVRAAIGESSLWATPSEANPECDVARNMLDVMTNLASEANEALGELLNRRTIAGIVADISASQEKRDTRRRTS